MFKPKGQDLAARTLAKYVALVSKTVPSSIISSASTAA